MKNSKTIYSLAIATIIIGVGGSSIYALAAENRNIGQNTHNYRSFLKNDLTEEQRAEIHTKMGIIKGEEFNHRGENLTEKQMAKKIKTKQAEQKIKHEAINKTIKDGDYKAWKATIGEEAPITKTINQENFGKYSEAYTHMQTARTIFEELGIKHAKHKRLHKINNHGNPKFNTNTNNIE